MNDYFLGVLDFGPVILQRMISQIEPHRLDEALEPGRFTPREAIAHMADWEPILRGRMQMTVNEPGSTIAGIDEGDRAIEMDYAHSDPVQQANTFLKERRKTLEWLKTLSQEQFSNVAIHNERGEMNLLRQANMLLGHDLYHIEQLSAYLGDKTASTW